MKQLLSRLAIVCFAPILGGAFFFGSWNVATTDIAGSVSVPDYIMRGPVENMATTIAYRHGLIRLARDGEINQALKSPMFKHYGKEEMSPWISVLNVDDDCATSNVPIAILATESYLRGPWRRNTEADVLQIIHTFTGWMPDWSVGPAQIKPSTYLRLMETGHSWLDQHAVPTSDIDLKIPSQDPMNILSELSGDCTSAALVSLAMLTHEDPTAGPAEHALRHVGGKRVPTLPGVVEYTRIVETLATGIMPDAFDLYRASVSEHDVSDRYPDMKISAKRLDNDWLAFDGVCLSADLLKTNPDRLYEDLGTLWSVHGQSEPPPISTLSVWLSHQYDPDYFDAVSLMQEVSALKLAKEHVIDLKTQLPKPPRTLSGEDGERVVASMHRRLFDECRSFVFAQ